MIRLIITSIVLSVIGFPRLDPIISSPFAFCWISDDDKVSNGDIWSTQLICWWGEPDKGVDPCAMVDNDEL